MPPKQLEEDLIAYIDHQLDEVGIARIERALEEDAQLRGLLSMLLRQRAMLAQVHAQRAPRATTQSDETREPNSHAEKTVRTTRLAQKKGRRRKNQSNMNAWLAAAAAVLILLAYFLLAPPAEQSAQQQPEIIKTPKLVQDLPVLARMEGTVELPAGLKLGEQFKAGQRLDIKAGARVQLNYPDGSIISLAEKTVSTVRKQKVIELETGSLSASVKKQTAGDTLSVHSHFGSVQVVGTTFTVYVDDEEMDTEVTEGQVKVEYKKDAKTFMVAANERIVLKQKDVEQYTTGIIIEVLARDNEGFIDIKTKNGVKRYVPPWGGNRNGRNAPNEVVMRQLEHLREREGKPITIRWKDDGEHLRVLEVID